MRGGPASKSLILAVIFIYCLTPYIMTRMNSGCGCGCQEYICQCCKNAEHLTDMIPVMECSENAGDESYQQSPWMSVPVFQLAVILDLVGKAGALGRDSALAGYRDPPMKPPTLM